ncbi:DrmB family protein [Nonomuraea sp. NPDC050663]|uniref:DrmB family protein n=1 Tax=Nonomuraea sp. NPDC050663 TaxID=3364370 RepID=UPI0037959D41
MRTVRLSQTISPFGVGAIVDVLGESLMGVDISEWPYERTVRVESKRLEERLGVLELRSPPSVPAKPSTNSPGIHYQRFPRWLFCQDCRRMQHYRSQQETGRPPQCGQCKGKLVPMRFVAVCATKGHIRDIPWDGWAHSEAESDAQRRCHDRVLIFETAAQGNEGLSGLVVRCRTCGASRDLGDLPSRGALKRIGVGCSGGQPWQRNTPPCDDPLEVLQRGATNVTLPDTTTALDIPEASSAVRDIAAEVRQHRNFEDVQSAPHGPRAAILIELIAEDLGVEEGQVRQALNGDPNEVLRDARRGLLSDEWDAFLQVTGSPDGPVGTPDFVISATRFIRPDPDVSPVIVQLDGYVDTVVLAHRLREIRVLHGFRRYTGDADLVDVNLGRRGRGRWLPAIESFGEGVFISLDQERLAEWERQEEVQERVAIIESRRRRSILGARLFEATPRAVLLHTLAHLLMRRLAFSCGYSSASLRERVYAETTPRAEAGLLIYTAAGDSEGTLGGLVREGESPRLARTFVAAIEEAGWCSSDPLCRESRGQGMNSLNRAACHGCSLVAETSCERSNVLLDRVLVVGDDTIPGFFQEILETIRAETVFRSQRSIHE